MRHQVLPVLLVRHGHARDLSPADLRRDRGNPFNFQSPETEGGLIANSVADNLRADGYTVTGGTRLTASRFRIWSVSCIQLAGVFQSLDPWGRA